MLKKENERDAKSDTQKADLRDKYNALQQENKTLKKQVEAKYNTERFTVEQELGEAKRDNTLLEAKNRQLESRVQQLEARLGGELDSEVSAEAQKAHESEIEEYERQIQDLRTQLASQFQRINALEQDITAHVSEKSKLQSEALKDKETVMTAQIELSQLKLQLKEMELV